MDNKNIAESKGRRKKVVLVEDEQLHAKTLTFAISNKFNCDVFVAGNGHEGYTLICDKLPDVVILDIMMPILNGYSLLEMIKTMEETRNIPVVILTNLDKQHEIKRGTSLGASEYLIKHKRSLQEVLEVIGRYV